MPLFIGHPDITTYASVGNVPAGTGLISPATEARFSSGNTCQVYRYKVYGRRVGGVDGEAYLSIYESGSANLADVRFVANSTGVVFFNSDTIQFYSSAVGNYATLLPNKTYIVSAVANSAFELGASNTGLSYTSFDNTDAPHDPWQHDVKTSRRYFISAEVAVIMKSDAVITSSHPRTLGWSPSQYPEGSKRTMSEGYKYAFGPINTLAPRQTSINQIGFQAQNDDNNNDIVRLAIYSQSGANPHQLVYVSPQITVSSPGSTIASYTQSILDNFPLSGSAGYFLTIYSETQGGTFRYGRAANADPVAVKWNNGGTDASPIDLLFATAGTISTISTETPAMIWLETLSPGDWKTITSSATVYFTETATISSDAQISSNVQLTTITSDAQIYQINTANINSDAEITGTLQQVNVSSNAHIKASRTITIGYPPKDYANGTVFPNEGVYTQSGARNMGTGNKYGWRLLIPSNLLSDVTVQSLGMRINSQIGADGVDTVRFTVYSEVSSQPSALLAITPQVRVTSDSYIDYVRSVTTTDNVPLARGLGYYLAIYGEYVSGSVRISRTSDLGNVTTWWTNSTDGPPIDPTWTTPTVLTTGEGPALFWANVLVSGELKTIGSDAFIPHTILSNAEVVTNSSTISSDAFISINLTSDAYIGGMTTITSDAYIVVSAQESSTKTSDAHIIVRTTVDILSNAEVNAPVTILSNAQIRGLVTLTSDSIVVSPGALNVSARVLQGSDDATRFI